MVVLSALAGFTVGLCNSAWLHGSSSQLSLQVSAPSSLQLVLVGEIEEAMILRFNFWSLRGEFFPGTSAPLLIQGEFRLAHSSPEWPLQVLSWLVPFH